jgi:hypothetical protein
MSLTNTIFGGLFACVTVAALVDSALDSLLLREWIVAWKCQMRNEHTILVGRAFGASDN